MSPLHSADSAAAKEQPERPPADPNTALAADVAALPALIQLEGDYAEDGQYGRRIFEVTAEQVRVMEANGAVSFQMPIAEVKSARNEPMVGGGQLEITTKTNEIVPVLAYSLTLAAKFSEAARGVEQLAKGRRTLHQSEAGTPALRKMQPPASRKGRRLPRLRQSP